MVLLIIAIAVVVCCLLLKEDYKLLETAVLKDLNYRSWDIIALYDRNIIVKSRQALDNYDEIKFFKEDKNRLIEVENIIKKKAQNAVILDKFLENNEYKRKFQYKKIEKRIKEELNKAGAYRIRVQYISSAGNYLGDKIVIIRQHTVDRINSNPALIMGKAEYSKLLKEQEKEKLDKKHKEY